MILNYDTPKAEEKTAQKIFDVLCVILDGYSFRTEKQARKAILAQLEVLRLSEFYPILSADSLNSLVCHFAENGMIEEF